MAKIYPERLPQFVINDPKLAAEREVYQSLAQLPSPYVVFYKINWQVRNRKIGARDGEVDFLVVHPEFGVMILEVKGGKIHYNAKQRQWFSVDRQNIVHEIKDPIDQARDNKGALLAKLRELPEWDNRFLTIGYMVVFPDVYADQCILRPDLPRQLLIDHFDLQNIEEKITQGFKWYWGEDRKQGATGIDRLKTIENLFGNSFILRTPLGVELAEEEYRLIELTERQMGLLRYIQKHRRALIEGCAGSGKTMLALEKARQLSEQGFDTLMLCFNAPLAEYLRQHVTEGIDVFHFHGLCQKFARQAGIGYRSFEDEQTYYSQVLPEMLFEAVCELGPQYDAIIVDEGQDFRDNWWEILFYLLRDQEQGIFYIFYDSNQNIYRRPSNLEQLIGTEPFTLWENCRNTNSIHRVVSQFHHDPLSLECRAPEGRPPELYFFADELQQQQLVQKTIHHLVVEEKVDTSHLVLLTTRSPEKTVFQPRKRLGNFQLVDFEWAETSRQSIRVSSVHRFKGLESRVVLLTGLEDNDPDWLNPLLYVACSRARTHLIIIAHERSRSQIEPLILQKRGKP